MHMFIGWCVGSLLVGCVSATLESKLAVDGDTVGITGWLFVTLAWFLTLPFYALTMFRKIRRLRAEHEAANLKPHMDELEEFLRMG